MTSANLQLAETQTPASRPFSIEESAEAAPATPEVTEADNELARELQTVVIRAKYSEDSAALMVAVHRALAEAGLRENLRLANKEVKALRAELATVQATPAPRGNPGNLFALDKGEDYHWAMKLQSFEPSPNHGRLSAEDAEHNAAVNYFRKKAGSPS